MGTSFPGSHHEKAWMVLKTQCWLKRQR